MATAARNISSSLHRNLSSAITKSQSLIDQRLPPEKRADIYGRVHKFAAERPLLASFLATHLALSAIPLLLLLTFATTVIISSLLTAAIVALLCACTFITFCVGIALLFLLPTLFVTIFLGTCVWFWGVAAFWTVLWVQGRRSQGGGNSTASKDRFNGGVKLGYDRGYPEEKVQKVDLANVG